MQTLAAIAVRIFAIKIALLAILNLVSGVNGLITGRPATIAITSSVIYLIISAFLWFFPITVSRKLLPAEQSHDLSLLKTVDLARVASFALGLWVLSEAIPSVIGNIFFQASQGIYQPPSSEYSAQFIRECIALVVGFFLLIANKPISNFLKA